MTADSFSFDPAASSVAATGAATDRELLELAAKAAGIVGAWERRKDYVQERWYFNVPYDNQGMLTGFEWNPLADDGDAFRLAVKLRLDVEFANDAISANDGGFGRWPIEAYGDDPYAATRRAIVRAAAEIGKSSGTVQTPTADRK